MEIEGLDYISVSGYKSLKDVQSLKLNPINVIIGANGSGKSNFISIFSFLHEIKEGRLTQYVRKAGGADQILHFGSKTTEKIRLSLSFHHGENHYDLDLGVSENDSLYPEDEIVRFWDMPNYDQPYSKGVRPSKKEGEAGISNENLKGIESYVQGHLDSWRLYHVHDTSSTSPLKKSANLNDNEYFRPDGSNLPAFLYLLQKKHKNSYLLIRKTIQRVAPYFDDFVLKPDALNEDSIRLNWKHKESDKFFSASHFSDGTLRFIALAVLLLQPEALRPSIIVIDEPELGLHPYAIEMLSSMVKSTAKETQVILSTQSSLLIDHFEPEDILVAEQREGATTFTRLSNEELDSWLDDYSLGQLWEKNHFGGRPTK